MMGSRTSQRARVRGSKTAKRKDAKSGKLAKNDAARGKEEKTRTNLFKPQKVPHPPPPLTSCCYPYPHLPTPCPHKDPAPYLGCYLFLTSLDLLLSLSIAVFIVWNLHKACSSNMPQHYKVWKDSSLKHCLCR